MRASVVAQGRRKSGGEVELLLLLVLLLAMAELGVAPGSALSLSHCACALKGQQQAAPRQRCTAVHLQAVDPTPLTAPTTTPAHPPPCPATNPPAPSAWQSLWAWRTAARRLL